MFERSSAPTSDRDEVEASKWHSGHSRSRTHVQSLVSGVIVTLAPYRPGTHEALPGPGRASRVGSRAGKKLDHRRECQFEDGQGQQADLEGVHVSLGAV